MTTTVEKTIALSALAQDTGITVDADAGIIAGASIVALGPALGHGFAFDSIGLDQVAARLSDHAQGAKVRFTHPSFTDDCTGKLLGRIRNIRRDGDRVRGDIHLGNYAAVSPSGDLRSYVLAIAQEDPTAIGLSIVFEPSGFEASEDGTPLARILDVVAVDVVDTPAANPAGFLSKPQETTTMPRTVKLGAQLGSYIGGLVDNATTDDMPRETVIANLAEASGIEVETLNQVLDGTIMCPTMERLEAIASHFSVDVTEMVAAAEEDGCSYEAAAPEEAAATEPEEDEEELAADPNTIDLAAVTRAAATAERNRIAELTSITERLNLGDAWLNTHITEATHIDAARKDAISMLHKNRPPVAAVTVGEDQNLETLGTAVSDAILLRAGQRLTSVDEDGNILLDANGRPQQRKPHARTREFRGIGLNGISRRYLNALSVTTDGMTNAQVARIIFNRAERMRLIGLAHGTSDFDSILADTIGKTLRNAYQERARTWQAWARRATAPDFKTISRTQLSGSATPPMVGENAEYTYATMPDGKETYVLAKYGHIFKLTWEAWINDDLSAFDRIPRAHGDAAARLEDDLAYAVLTDNAAMNDGTALFHADHGNLKTSGDAGAPSVTTLGAARAAMEVQTGLNDERLEIEPAVLLVPSSLRTTAEELIASTVKPGDGHTVNIFADSMDLVSSARLEANSATAWYVIGNNAQVDTVEVAFLEGYEAPTLEEEDTFNTDARSYKVRHVAAAAAIDHRGMLKNTG